MNPLCRRSRINAMVRSVSVDVGRCHQQTSANGWTCQWFMTGRRRRRRPWKRTMTGPPLLLPLPFVSFIFDEEDERTSEQDLGLNASEKNRYFFEEYCVCLHHPIRRQSVTEFQKSVRVGVRCFKTSYCWPVADLILLTPC